MEKIIGLLITLCCLWTSAHGQDDTSTVILYRSNGETLKGLVKGSFFGKTRIKLETPTNKITVRLSKLDSLRIDSQNHIVSKSFSGPDLLLQLSSGVVDLYKVNNAVFELSYKGKERVVVAPSTYMKALSYLEIEQTETSQEITHKKFISEIQKFNQRAQASKILPMDYLLKSSRLFIPRISFLRPEIGAEIKLAKEISLYNSVGMNFGGDFFRNAQTFINYDYSGEIRYFYRQQKRLTKGKINYNFSGPFVAGTYKYLIDINRLNQNFIGMLYGWQKTEPLTNTYIAYRIGLGYNLKQENTQFFSALTLGRAF